MKLQLHRVGFQYARVRNWSFPAGREVRRLDRQTLPMRIPALRDYAGQRGWIVPPRPDNRHPRGGDRWMLNGLIEPFQQPERVPGTMVP